MLIQERIPGFKNPAYRTKSGLHAGGLWVPKHQNIMVIRNREFEGGKFHEKELFLGSNIVTDEGDKYYAQKSVGETPSNAFNSLYLSTVNWGTTPAKTHTSTDIASMISGSEKAVAATYPKTNDGDADNTGAGVDIVSWLFSYAKADFNDADIDAGAVSIASVPAWGSGGTALLTAFDLTAFGKTANDTLKVFVNHQMNGV